MLLLLVGEDAVELRLGLLLQLVELLLLLVGQLQLLLRRLGEHVADRGRRGGAAGQVRELQAAGAAAAARLLLLDVRERLLLFVRQGALDLRQVVVAQFLLVAAQVPERLSDALRVTTLDRLPNLGQQVLLLVLVLRLDLVVLLLLLVGQLELLQAVGRQQRSPELAEDAVRLELAAAPLGLRFLLVVLLRLIRHRQRGRQRHQRQQRDPAKQLHRSSPLIVLMRTTVLTPLLSESSPLVPDKGGRPFRRAQPAPPHGAAYPCQPSRAGRAGRTCAACGAATLLQSLMGGLQFTKAAS